jgi:hypothetical protein
VNRISLVPSARRLMGSLRDLGYELPQAVAELVDNSIDAGATEIHIRIHFEGADSWIRVADDGRGMTSAGLDEAMRYGSAGDYEPGALGGFGLGLKTASFSQCRRLSVATRQTDSGRPEIRCWDLDEIGSADDWLLERLLPEEAPEPVLEPLASGRGTVVLWEGLDRVLLYQNPWGARAETAMQNIRAGLAQHLSMVFHRFLSGEARRQLPLRILVDDVPLDPWDPYARAEGATQVLPEQRIEFEIGGQTHWVMTRPFLLPSQQRFSTPEAHHAAGGPRKWNRQQGFYIYREDRLIQSGGWSRLRTQDEHTKLARIALDIPREADEAFGVNVSKMRVTLPEALRPPLRALVTGIVARAQDRYRAHQPRDRSAGPAAASVPSDASVVLQDLAADFIPRAQVVTFLRRELGDDPALLRRLVNAVLTQDWHQELEGNASDGGEGPLPLRSNGRGLASDDAAGVPSAQAGGLKR